MSVAEESRAPKRRKAAGEDDLICPITYELPFYPVTAEDGLVYERSAIEQYFETKEDVLSSPITGETMGPLATSWQQKVKEKKRGDEWVKKAEGGDALVMCMVGDSYKSVHFSFPQNYKAAFKWFGRSHRAGFPPATKNLALMLLCGDGVAKNKSQGIMYLTMAAERGSGYAAYLIGKAIARGDYGLSIDKDEAIAWLLASLDGNCEYSQMDVEDRRQAQRWIRRVRADRMVESAPRREAATQT